MKRLHILLMLLLTFYAASAAASEVIVINNDMISCKIGKKIDLLEDRDGKLTIKDMLDPAVQKRFQPSTVEVPNYGYTSSVYWVRFSLRFDGDMGDHLRYIVELSYPLMNFIRLYVPDGKGAYTEKRAGDDVPFAKRDFKHRHYLFFLPYHNEVRTYYFRFETPGTFRLPLEIWSLKSYIERDDIVHYALGAYYGLSIVMIILYFMLFLVFRDKSYLYFWLYIVTFAVFQTLQNGVLFEFLEPDAMPWKFRAYLITGILPIMAASRFGQIFLSTKKNMPLFHMAFWGVIILSAFLVFFSAATDFLIPLKIRLYAILGQVIVVIILAAGSVALYRGFRPAIFFLLAWTTFTLGVLLFSLQSFALIPTNVFTIYIMQFASVSVTILMTIGIMDRIRRIQVEKDAAQETALINEKKARYAQEEMVQQLRSMNALKDQFLANTSHELRTPLNGIIGIAESLYDGSQGEVSQPVKNNLSLISTSGKRLLRLINDILDFTRIKNDDLNLELKPVDLYQAVAIVYDVMGNVAREHAAELHNEIPRDFVLVLGDEERIQQILFNLIGNAIKFSEGGSITASASVDEGGMVHCSIRDEGIGIPGDKQGIIFEEFEQADGTITKRFGGTGLGLSITKKLVELQGGTIRVESEEQKGSTFTFTLPQYAPDMIQKLNIDGSTRKDTASLRYMPEQTVQSYEDFSNAENQVAGDERQYRILLVDDDVINLQVLENHLSGKNYLIQKAHNGIIALELLRSQFDFDLVILDIMMPRISGYDVLKEIRETHSLYELPVILLSAKNQINDIVTGLSYGANDYLSKPFNKNELLARVSTLITLKYAVEESKTLLIIQEELALARRIQQSLFPGGEIKFQDCTISCRCDPTASVGGDFYDFFVYDDNRLGVLIVDVAGHGIPAALIASMVKVVSSIFASEKYDPEKFLVKMNETLYDKMGSLFLTASLLQFDYGTQTVSYVRAGHEPLLILNRQDAGIQRIEPKGRACGWFPEIKIEKATFPLKKGSRLVLYSDGIIEAMTPDQKMFGSKGFDEFLRDNVELHPDEVIEKLFTQLKSWSHMHENRRYEDDMTIIIIDP